MLSVYSITRTAGMDKQKMIEIRLKLAAADLYGIMSMRAMTEAERRPPVNEEASGFRVRTAKYMIDLRCPEKQRGAEI